MSPQNDERHGHGKGAKGVSPLGAAPPEVRITDDIAAVLKSYVYVYIDPRTGEPFYIGKGQGSRLFAHLEDQSESEKAARIAEMRQEGQEPRIDILYGLSDAEATLVEAAGIDLIGKRNLTNRVAGHDAGSFARITSQELLVMLTAKPVEVRHRAILITINKLYRSDMSSLELYEATRAEWVVGRRRSKAEYAMAVYQGVVREVYRIEQWNSAGTLRYETRDFSGPRASDRWEFTGHVQPPHRFPLLPPHP
jgi:hypothetical protein